MFAASGVDEPVAFVLGRVVCDIVSHQAHDLFLRSIGIFYLSSDKSDVGFGLFGLVQIEVRELLPALVLDVTDPFIVPATRPWFEGAVLFSIVVLSGEERRGLLLYKRSLGAHGDALLFLHARAFTKSK